jgi:pimeloyl-ACP methyl ester carboxylesterase
MPGNIGNFGIRTRDHGPEFGPDPDQNFTGVFVAAADDLRLHVRLYGSRTPSSLPVVCLPGLARTAADFHSLATALANDPADPRWVVAVDYRGHGKSDYDRRPKRYGVRTDLADLAAILTALRIGPAIFVGTSLGGILAMKLAHSRPAATAGVVLNDIGPIIEPQALLRIKGYMEKLPTPRNFVEGGEILRWLFATHFPEVTPEDWIAFAKRTWREHGGRFVPDYDVKLSRRLDNAVEHSAIALWDEFDALAAVPMMIIRGANSTMLTSRTMNSLLGRRRQLDMFVVPGQGHAPPAGRAKFAAANRSLRRFV